MTNVDLSVGYNPLIKKFYNQFKHNINFANYPTELDFSHTITSIRKHYNLDQEIVLGNGSDELIDAIFQFYDKKYKNKLELYTPTNCYKYYQIFANKHKIKTFELARNQISANVCVLELSQVVKSLNYKILILDSPSNPEGLVINISELKKLLNIFNLVIIDHAYIEFSDPEYDFSNFHSSKLIVLRTFSKWAGLSALRIGFMIADTKISNEIRRYLPKFNVNSLALAFARIALENKQTIINKFVQPLIESRNTLTKKTYKNFTISGYGGYFILTFKNKTHKNYVLYKLAKINIKIADGDDFGFPNSLRMTVIGKTESGKILKLINNIEI